MSRWSHAICDACWAKKNPNHEPGRLKSAVCEECCYCGNPTIDGIYVRDNPDSLTCKGVHKDKEEEDAHGNG